MTNASNTGLDFPTVLASSVHDMKNSLCLVIQSIEQLTQELAGQPHATELSRLHYETQRINTSLVQLLALYREQQDSLPLNTDLHYIDDIVDELCVNHEVYAQQRGVVIEIEIDDELQVFADRDLLATLLNDVVVNALRYTADKIVVTAKKTPTDEVEICVSDNGPGYPESMLAEADKPIAQLDLLAARTGLGLYFAHLIAMHHQRHGKSGRVQLQNGGRLGGSEFRLTLP